MPHNASQRIFIISQYGTTVETTWIDAVMAGGRDVLHNWQRSHCAIQQTHFTPRLLLVESIERMTGDNASLAAATCIEIHFKCVLLP